MIKENPPTIDCYPLVLGTLGDVASVIDSLVQLGNEDARFQIVDPAISNSDRIEEYLAQYGLEPWILKQFTENKDFAAANQRNIVMQGAFFFSILREMPQLLNRLLDYLIEKDFFDQRKTMHQKELVISLSAWVFFAPMLFALGIRPVVVGVADGIDPRTDGQPFLLHSAKLSEEKGLVADHEAAAKGLHTIFTRPITFFTRRTLEKRGLNTAEVADRLSQVRQQGVRPEMAKATIYASDVSRENAVRLLDNGAASHSPLVKVNRTAVNEVQTVDQSLEQKLEDQKYQRVIAFMSGSMVIEMKKLKRMMAYAQEQISKKTEYQDVLIVYVNAHGDKKDLPSGNNLFATAKSIPLAQLFGHEKCIGAFIHGGAGTSAQTLAYGLASVSYIYTDEQKQQTEQNHKALEMMELDNTTKHIGDVNEEIFWQDITTLITYQSQRAAKNERDIRIPLGNEQLKLTLKKVLKNEEIGEEKL